MSSNTTLGLAADDRKNRLAKLRSLKRKQPEDDADGPAVEPDSEPTAASTRKSPPPSNDTTDQDGGPQSAPFEKDVSRLYVSGRNYDPETRGPKFGFDAPPTLALERATLEEQAAELEADVRAQTAADEGAAAADKGIDLFKLQPKKPNWDLKRELARKMDVLSARTDAAIARLVRERLTAKKAAGVGGASKGESKAAGDGEESAGLDGAELVEGVRLREQEEEEEKRSEREDEDLS